MAEMPAVIGQGIVAIPVICQLDGRVFLSGRGEEDEGEPAFFAFDAPGLFQSQQIAIERLALFDVADAHHGVEVFQGHELSPWVQTRLGMSPAVARCRHRCDRCAVQSSVHH